jgi:hypothetical protein
LRSGERIADVSGPDEEVRLLGFLRQVDDEATRVADDDDVPNEAASRLWALGLEAASDEALRSIAYPIWLIWGCLTDMAERPRADPAEAPALMRRAALEWLEARRLPAELKSYLDRWVFLECGYERPQPE